MASVAVTNDSVSYQSAVQDSSGTGRLSDGGLEVMEIPVHPVPAMQAAFEESISESTDPNDTPSSPAEADARARRHQLLEAKQYDDTWTSRWKQRPNAQCHPLSKLLAQVVFGMHLLQQQQARSEKEVVKILQTHVNEVDTFLERTAEDFDVAIADVEDRIRYLKLPMTHIEVFEKMLDDKKFRTQLLTGNDKIERIIERTARSMNAALYDVEKGIKANKELGRYMNSVQEAWPQNPRAIFDVLAAMRGNEQGWKRYLKDLQAKGNTLGRTLAQLQRLISEMSGMAAAASRRNKTPSSTIIPEHKSTSSPAAGPRSKFAQVPSQDSSQSSSPRFPERRTSNLNKPLPIKPQAAAATTPTSDSAPKPHPVPFAERYERPRQSPPEPASPPRTSSMTSTPRQRPKTAGEARAADARVNPSELLNFFQRPDPLGSNPNPLRSNPPEIPAVTTPSKTTGEETLGRSQSHGPNVIIGTFNDEGGKVMRSMSQGAIDVLSAPANQSMETRVAHRTKNSVDAARSLQSPEHPAKGLTENTEKRAAMKNTGFARRLSKRLKHLPMPTERARAPENPPIQAAAPIHAPKTSSPPDSAYVSWKDKDSPPNGSAEIEPAEKAERPVSVLGPLPFAYQNPLPPSDEIPRPSESSGSSPGMAASVKSLASGKSRAMSFRNAFRTKWNKAKAVAA